MTKSIADTIHDAIENHLWDGGDYHFKRVWSCWAVADAENKNWDCLAEMRAPMFLKSFGLYGTSCFDEFVPGPKRQYARALALTFAELIAREEGI